MSLPGRIPDDPPVTNHRALAEGALAIAASHASTDTVMLAVVHALLSIDGHLAKVSGHYRWVNR
jgi:hypothetical protein